MKKRLILEQRTRVMHITDPQRRCYNGCFHSYEWVWSEWDWLQIDIPEEMVEKRLTFWRELNDYSLSVGGQTRSEFRVREMTTEERKKYVYST